MSTEEKQQVQRSESEDKEDGSDSKENEVEYKKNLESKQKEEEEKFKRKFPNYGQNKGGSAFLQQRLSKGQRFFDSGDYNMAVSKKTVPQAGKTIPTPENVAPFKKTSINQSKLTNQPL